MNEEERAKMLELGEAGHALLAQLEDIPSEMRSQAVGMSLAVMDALFAIRNGTEWRGLTDPKAIAGKMLRDMGVTE